MSELVDEHDLGSCALRRGGSSSAIPQFAEVVNEPLKDTITVGFGKILNQVKGEAIKGGTARTNSCPDFGNPKEDSC